MLLLIAGVIGLLTIGVTGLFPARVIVRLLAVPLPVRVIDPLLVRITIPLLVRITILLPVRITIRATDLLLQRVVVVRHPTVNLPYRFIYPSRYPASLIVRREISRFCFIGVTMVFRWVRDVFGRTPEPVAEPGWDNCGACPIFPFPTGRQHLVTSRSHACWQRLFPRRAQGRVCPANH